MNKFIKKLIDKFNKKFKQELERQKNFFKKPDVLAALVVSSLILLDKMLEKKSKAEIKALIQSNPFIKNILNYTSKEFNDDSLNELLLNCLNGNETTLPNLPEQMLASEFLSYADKFNDIDNKINFNKLQSLSDKFKGETTVILSCLFLLYYIIDMTKDLLTKTEYPSKYRTKYIQKLTRNVYGLLKLRLNSLGANVKNEVGATKETTKIVKESLNSIKKQIKDYLKILKQIDNILIAVSLATSIYIINRSKLQKRTKQTLDEVSSDIICLTSPEASEVSTVFKPIQLDLDNFSCPINVDDELIPHEPIELKLQNLSCEVNQNIETISDISDSTDLATYAIIRNSKKDKMYPAVTIDTYLTPESRLASINGKAIYSPVNGYVKTISKNQIILRDISDPTEDPLTTQVNLLNEKYERLNAVKSFIKNYYISSLYPNMLAVSIIDYNTNIDLAIGVKHTFDLAKSRYETLNEDFEKQIKNITGKDNVEKNAKNETLYLIKDQMESLEKIFYKNLEVIAESALNTSKIVTTDKGELQLFEYYTFDLQINATENPTKVEIEFRDIVNEFSRKRYVIEEYKKDRIKDKINDLIKNIEKGGSSGDWFTKALEKYLPKRQLSDVKSWLMGMANDNTKLESTEKINQVNKTIFLFEFYLNADQLSQKYNLGKDEETLKLQTVLEGNTLKDFTQNLWKELYSIPNEIKEIQNKIDSLSSFQTYSITEWEGYQSRLYLLSDEPTCKSIEKDDYLNPKSAKGYGDIEYWLKYCAFATLASVTNPATGWSTGWIAPSPILFPIVYIPIKPIYTKYGFIVIGISICGIWVFPWILFANLTTNHNTPLGDPTAILKKEIDAMKKEISEGLLKLKKVTVKKMMITTKTKIDTKNKQIDSIKNSINENKSKRPKKTIANEKVGAKTAVKTNVNYTKELTNWTEKSVSLQEQLTKTKTENWQLTKKYKILNEAYKEDKSVKGISGLEQTEKLLNSKLDVLVGLIDKVDNILAPLPITLKPDSASFGITLKNTKPIIKIADELDDNVNEAPLNSIFAKFELKNKDMMSTKYSSKLSNSMANFKSYKSTLSASMLSIIKKDPFPKYESLKATNVQWLAFLYKDFVTTGAKTYGFPGQMPVPV